MKNIKKLALVFALCQRIDPWYTPLLIFKALVNAGRVLTNVLLPKYLIDELAGASRPQQLALWVGLIVFGNVFWTLMDRTCARAMQLHQQRLLLGVDKALSEKIMSVPYRFLEDPYYLDLRERARFAMQNQNSVSNLITSAANALTQLITLLTLTAVMLQLSWVLLAILAATVCVMLLIQAGFARYQVAFFDSLLPVNRRYGYYVGLSFGTQGQKDFRLYGMSGMLADRITQYNGEIFSWFGRYYRRQGFFMGLYQLVTVAQTALAYGFVGVRCLNGALSIGSLSMYVSASVQFSGAVIALGSAVVTMGQMLSYLDPFYELMTLPEAQADACVPFEGPVSSIRFEHVSFRYPKSDALVLDDLSFCVEKGQKISIVGLNGAGKSTVVKLLCRLYVPDRGRICVNGRDIAAYERESYLREIAAVFQDFKLMHFSIEENVTCSPSGTDPARLARIFRDVGLEEKINSLPKGAQTLFGRALDREGAQLSGGQEQKLAIARALYKDASLVILDEPTSALDPMAEAELYEQFNAMVGDKTAIYISHRMSSSVFCDKILVLNGGKAEAFDTHANLMAQTDSTYYRLFHTQAVHYQIDPESEASFPGCGAK